MTKYSATLSALSAQCSAALVAALVLGQILLLLGAQVALSQGLKADVLPGECDEAPRGVAIVPDNLAATLARNPKHLWLQERVEWSTCCKKGGEAGEAGHTCNANTTVAPERKTPRLITLDADARIFLMENLLTDEECDHIIGLAEPRMHRSGVVDALNGGTTLDDIRTSSGTFLSRGEDDIIRGIEERIAAWTLLPVVNGEALQVLRYEPTQRYGGHYDYFFDEENTKNGGNRFATVLMYLNDVPEGGETTFPNIPAPGGDNGPDFSDCARHVLATKPKKGSAVLFHSIDLEGNLETRSFHEACPVIRGVKWSAPKWIHQRRHSYGGDDYAWEPERAQNKRGFVGKLKRTSGCEDDHPLCRSWAASGECERNADFMLGTHFHAGKCLKSCNKCNKAEAPAEDPAID